MDLSLLKNFFVTALEVHDQLKSNRKHFDQVNVFSLYRAIANRSEPRVDLPMVRSFITSFNWEVSFISSNEVNPNGTFKMMNLLPQMNSDQTLDFGLELFMKEWGTDGELNFSQFCQFTRGRDENPDSSQRELPFPAKKNLFGCLIDEINGLIKIQAFKKAIYHQYRNMTDLFQMLTPHKTFDIVQLNLLFLSLSDRRSEEEIATIADRIRLPWDFNKFLSTFKGYSAKKVEKEYKIHYSSKRKKGNDTPDDRAFTTPRKSKGAYAFSSTKLTKGDAIQDLVQYSREVSEFSESKTQLEGYVDILGEVLFLEEEFIKQSKELIMREDFDLELVYERYGKKFQKILNKRYGVCNYSAFVRYIVPRDFEHRYLCFIRYQANNTLSSTTESLIEDFILRHYEKQQKIQQLWAQCDLQLLQRAFCQPCEKSIKTNKLCQYFTKRETTILADRLDPCGKGTIEIEDLR